MICATSKASDQPALHIRAIWSEPLLVAWIFYECLATDWTSFGVSKFKRRLHRLAWVYDCQMPHCWKSHVAAHLKTKSSLKVITNIIFLKKSAWKLPVDLEFSAYCQRNHKKNWERKSESLEKWHVQVVSECCIWNFEYVWCKYLVPLCLWLLSPLKSGSVGRVLDLGLKGC